MAKKLTQRESIEKVLMTVAKKHGMEIVRSVPHGLSRSGIGALQAVKGGSVMISVRNRDVVVYVSPKTLKAGRPGPKGWENVAHFKHDTPVDIFTKVFTKAATAKRSTVNNKPKSKKDLAAQRKVLEAQLERIKKEEAAMKIKKAKPKAKPKPSAEDQEARKRALGAQLAKKAEALING